MRTMLILFIAKAFFSKTIWLVWVWNYSSKPSKSALPHNMLITQIGALSETVSVLGVSPWICGGVCGVLLAYCLWGGRERIGRWNGVLVPAASALYVSAMGWILLTHLPAVPNAFSQILQGALGIRPLAGGVSGALIAAAMREGFAAGKMTEPLCQKCTYARRFRK